MPDHTTFTVPELADYWHCSTDIIYDLLRSGKLQGFKLGKSWRVSDAARKFYEQTPAEPDYFNFKGTGKRVLTIH